MGLIALMSPGGAPGATTTALALTLAWPAPVVMVEANVAGSSVLPGFFDSHLSADRGLLQLALALAEYPEQAEAALWGQVVPLDEAGERPVLVGPRDPFQAQAITTASWERLAALLARQDCAVLADLGEVRAEEFAWPLLERADLVVLVLRPTARQVIGAAHPRLSVVRQRLGPRVPVGLCLVGRGVHELAEIRAVLGDFAVVVQLPHDPKAAARLSDGRPARRLQVSSLLVQAQPAARSLHQAAAEHRARHAQPTGGGHRA